MGSCRRSRRWLHIFFNAESYFRMLPLSAWENPFSRPEKNVFLVVYLRLVKTVGPTSAGSDGGELVICICSSTLAGSLHLREPYLAAGGHHGPRE